MNEHMKLMAVKGLIMSMDEQIYQYFQKDNLPENLKNIIVNKYYDAILEQLEQSEDEKKKKFINELYKQGVISENVKNELLNKIIQSDLDFKNDNVEEILGEKTSDYDIKIIINGRRHSLYVPASLKISWEEIVRLSGLAKTGKEILTINYTGGDNNDGGYSNGMLEVNDSIQVKEGMEFNVCNTSKLKGE